MYSSAPSSRLTESRSHVCPGFWINATLLSSSDLLSELETRLARPKFEKHVDENKRMAFIADLRLAAVQVEISGILKACRDPDDDKLLEIAVIGKADCIVTGDQDLLVLDPFQNVRILNPGAFLEAIVV